MKVLSSLLILIGLVLLTAPILLIYQRSNPKRLSFVNATNIQSVKVEGSKLPKRLVIETIGVDLNVEPVAVNGNFWPTSKTGVSYVSGSSTPGEVGNTIMYGHNWSGILGNLWKIKPGDTIKIINESGVESDFTVSTTQVVENTQNSVLKNTDDRRVTLYTCAGFLDQKRFVVTALLAS